MEEEEELTAHTPTNASEHPQSWQPPEVTVGKPNTHETLEMESGLEKLSAEKIDIESTQPEMEGQKEEAKSSPKRTKKMRIEMNVEQPMERKCSRTRNMITKKEKQ